MLLCSNNPFRFLVITLLAACLLTAWPISLYAENSHAKKVPVLHSSHRVFPRFKNIDKGCKDSLIKDDPSIETHTEKFPVFTTREVDKATGLGHRINKDGKNRHHKQEEKWLNRKIIRFNII